MVGGFRAFGLAVAAGSVPMLVAAAMWFRDCRAGVDCGRLEPLALVRGLGLAVVVGAVCALVLATARLTRQRALALGPVALGACCSVALLAATPVKASWNDGCNDHSARLPLIEAPRVWWGSPESTHAAYEDMQTLVLCSSVGELWPAPNRPRVTADGS
jgi:hypothetical protein